MTIYAGIDIGGTKCAVTLGYFNGDSNGDSIDILDKIAFPTPATANEAITMLVNKLDELLARQTLDNGKLVAIGISCGGPLDSRKGIILSPPNLPHWDGVDVVGPFQQHFGVPAGLQNDANACALAEWQWGAGRGTRNMIFLTFGTGMGAGMILNGQLYSGTNDNAGEIGHVRLTETGPIGFNKAGSFEGYCSGGGIARQSRNIVKEKLASGEKAPLFYNSSESIDSITTKDVAEAAQQGDELALQIFRDVGRNLGKGLAILIDVINPEKIVIGSIYSRQRELMETTMMEQLRKEAIPGSLAVCDIVPAGLGEHVGDYAALSVARTMHLNTLEEIS